MDGPSRISRDQVLQVAKLARLELSAEEVERMRTQLDAILGYIDALSVLDVSEVPPYFRVAPVAGQLRDDVVTPSLDRTLALSQAPAQLDGGFAVPQVMEDDG